MLDLMETKKCMEELPHFLNTLKAFLPPHYNRTGLLEDMYRLIVHFEKEYLDKAIIKDNKGDQ